MNDLLKSILNSPGVGILLIELLRTFDVDYVTRNNHLQCDVCFQ